MLTSILVSQVYGLLSTLFAALDPVIDLPDDFATSLQALFGYLTAVNAVFPVYECIAIFTVISGVWMGMLVVKLSLLVIGLIRGGGVEWRI